MALRPSRLCLLRAPRRHHRRARNQGLGGSAAVGGSTIDAFGIFCYANDTVRGGDLAPLFRYQPGDKLPAMFEETPRR